MFEIRKEVLNGGENLVSSTIVNYVNLDAISVINQLSSTFGALAKSDTLYYKLRGSDNYVRYVFREVKMANANDLILSANQQIKLNINNANARIDFLNKSVKLVNRRIGNADKNIIEEIKENEVRNNEAKIVVNGEEIIIE